MKELSEEQLRESALREAAAKEAVHRVLEGDVEAFSAIVKLYGGLVTAELLKRVRPSDVQDVAQAVFVKVYQGLGKYRGEGPFWGWMRMVVRNAASDHWRTEYARKDLPEGDLSEGERIQAEGEAARAAVREEAERDAEAERREWLERGLRMLSPEDRAVITMTELEGMSMKETAAELGCGLAAVKVRAFRARTRLRKALEATRKGEAEP